VADLSPLRGFCRLEHLSIRQTRVTNLSPLADDENLSELIIDTTQVPSLDTLQNLKKLLSLTILNNAPVNVDLSPVGQLTQLRRLSITGIGSFDVAPLKKFDRSHVFASSGTLWGDRTRSKC
jgi:internalin A